MMNPRKSQNDEPKYSSHSFLIRSGSFSNTGLQKTTIKKAPTQEKVETIKFGDTGDYHVFSNATPSLFNIYIGRSSIITHDFQSVYSKIEKLRAEAKLPSLDTNPSLKKQLIYELLLAKFTQQPSFLAALLNTNIAVLIYNEDKENLLGEALMYTRETLRYELEREEKVEIRTTLSDTLTKQLGITKSLAPSEPSYVSASQLSPEKAIINTELYVLSEKDLALQKKVTELFKKQHNKKPTSPSTTGGSKFSITKSM